MRSTFCWLMVAMEVISVRLREMSSATAVCSSAAVAICRFMSRIASTASVMRCSISPASVTWPTPCSLRTWPLSMARTALLAPVCTVSMIWWISAVDSAVRWARVRTSSATTAKPRPASPARAASMAALSASRLVWSAMPRMTSSTLPIRPLSPSSRRMTSAVLAISLLMSVMLAMVPRITASPCCAA